MNDTALLEDAVSSILKDYYANDTLVAAKTRGLVRGAVENPGRNRHEFGIGPGGIGGNRGVHTGVVRTARRGRHKRWLRLALGYAHAALS